MALHILGIRHHGVGSARHVLKRLEEINPDIILIEGPPEITEVLSYVGHPDLVPPVSIMVYNIDNPQQASFYPFTVFSPEWVAIGYAIEKGIPFKAIDMPSSISFNINKKETETYSPISIQDPMAYFARAAGHQDAESWWDYTFERNTLTIPSAHFEAVDLAINEMRNAQLKDESDNELREAYMREAIRNTANEMYTNIAVICGAWHGPSLKNYDAMAKQDTKALKAIPKSKLKIATTWIPWTNDRLSMQSGYGAGIYSPGWYEHLWTTAEDYETKWLINVARTFRAKDIDVSSAHVIEARRLAECLAAIRNKSTVTLAELNDATQSVICMGDNVLLNYIKKELIIANKIGAVPDDIPKVPIQEDFEKIIKSLKLPLAVTEKQYDLDLRNPTDLQRSILFFRLEILGVKWASRTFKRSKGTFRESWILAWRPEMMIDLIDKAYLGNTIYIACTAFVKKELDTTTHINRIASFFGQVLPAELFDLIDPLLSKIHELSSISSDIIDLMRSVPPLIEVGRYGNVRNADIAVVNSIVENLILKINIGLANACYGLDDEHSEQMFQLIFNLNEAINLIENKNLIAEWYVALQLILHKENIHPLIQGCICRLLLDHNIIDNNEALRLLSYALSQGNDAMKAAYWLEGFLKGSAMILIYDNHLWSMLYQWLENLSPEQFDDLLPFLRRSFSKFEFGERRQIGEKAKMGILNGMEKNDISNTTRFDHQRGEAALPIILKFLGGNNE